VSFEQTFDQHDDEQGPPAQPFTLRTLEEIEGIMSGVARSIEALDNGTYGNCEQCATPIAKQTMIENPLATRCDAHVVRERPVLFAEADLDKPDSVEPDSSGAESDSADSELADA
jgi:RNA polymerase-binding transcription factor DksA